MSRTLLVRLSASAIALGCAWIAYTQAPPAPQGKDGKQAKQPNNTITKVTDDLYAIIGDGGNSSVYITNEGVILVDDKFEYDGQDIIDKVKSVTNQPIKYVLNTHLHGDHTGSNEKFLPIAEVIAHKNARDNMVKNKAPGVMRVVFTEETAIFLGGKEVRMRYFGRSHTNGDAVVYFPALKILASGDMGANNGPNVDFANGGSIKDWGKTLDEVLKLDFDTVIPGHGPVSKRQYLIDYRNVATQIPVTVTSMVREGKSKDDIAKVFMTNGGLWVNPNVVNKLDQIMAELKN
jgi:glyoxylase-like metal-dependent hydrolase (beta-lactamase superfamily II)